MIRVSVDLISAQGAHRNRHQAMIDISNVGGTEKQGNYNYVITGKRGQVLRAGTIEGFPRKELLAIDLLTLCLVDARGSRIKSKMK